MKSRVMLLIAAGLMFVSGLTHAYAVTVVNPSFELPTDHTGWTVNTNGAYNTTVQGWTAGGSGLYGTWDPADAKFNSNPLPHGLQVAYFYTGNASIEQTTAETLQAGYTYTLSASVGARNDTTAFTFGGGKIELLAGTNVIATASTATTQTLGTWVLAQLVFTATGANPYLGQQLSIRLSKVNPGTTHTSFDNVTLTAVPLPVAAWLFGSALLGLGWARCSRSRQQEVLAA